MIAGTPERRAGDLRAARLLAELPRLPLPEHRRRSGHRPVVPHRRRDHGAARAAADRRRHARGLAQIPDRMREASYALGKTRATTIRHVLLPSIRPNIAERRRARDGPDHRRHRDRRSILLGATLKTRTGERHAGRRPAARHRLDADELRLLQLARRRGQRPPEGLCRRVRAADDRAGAQLRRDAPQQRASVRSIGQVAAGGASRERRG